MKRIRSHFLLMLGMSSFISAALILFGCDSGGTTPITNSSPSQAVVPATPITAFSASQMNSPPSHVVEPTTPIQLAEAAIESKSERDENVRGEKKATSQWSEIELKDALNRIGKERFTPIEIKKINDFRYYISQMHFENTLNILKKNHCDNINISAFRGVAPHNLIIIVTGCQLPTIASSDYPTVISVNKNRVKEVDLSGSGFMYQSGKISAISDLNNNGYVEFWLSGAICECDGLAEGDICDCNGTMIVEDSDSRDDLRASPEDIRLHALTGTPFNNGSLGDMFYYLPIGISTDGTNLYVADWGYNKIRKIVIATGMETTLAGSLTFGSLDAKGAAASFSRPNGVVSDGKSLYVADSENNKIRKIEISTGVVTTLAGTGAEGSHNAAGRFASFNNPSGIIIDGSNLYVSDTRNHKIRKIVIATGKVSTLAGSGNYGSVDGEGTDIMTSFNNPNGITSDGSNLYVADTQNHIIRKVVIASGMVSTLAGSGKSSYVDGKGNASSFNWPFGITINDGNLFVTDTKNHRIRKVVIATGMVSTLAGSGNFGSDDGTGTAASFFDPHGITTDGTNLYVTDSGNHKIRKIVIATGVVTTLDEQPGAGRE